MSAELHAVAARVRELHRLAQEVYGDDSPAASRFGDTLASLARLCIEMQAQAGADLPENQAKGLYY